MGQIFEGAAAAASSTGSYQESCVQCVQAGGVAAATATHDAAGGNGDSWHSDHSIVHLSSWAG